MEKYPELNYVPDGPPNNPQAHLHWRFFDCMVDPDSGRYLSEDYAFCRRWRDIGGKVFVDSMQADASRAAHVPRRSRREPAPAGALVSTCRAAGAPTHHPTLAVSDAMSTSHDLARLLSIGRLTHVVDIGANPIEGSPPYRPPSGRSTMSRHRL